MGNSFVFDLVFTYAFAEGVKWPTATTVPCVYCVLGIPTTPPTTANKSAWYRYNDIAYSSAGVPFELNTVSTGYTLGGNAMNTTAAALSTHTTVMAAGAATTFTGTGVVSCTYAATQWVPVSSTALTVNYLMSCHDLGGTQTASNGTLTLTWSGSGVWTVTSSGAA